MCGRYTITVSEEELMLGYLIDQSTNRYQCDTGSMGYAMICGGVKTPGVLNWGIIECGTL
jgi:hypothetical protein